MINLKDLYDIAYTSNTPNWNWLTLQALIAIAERLDIQNGLKSKGMADLIQQIENSMYQASQRR